MAGRDVEVTRALRSERDVVAQLLELNAFEFSRLDGRSIRENATYGYRYLDAYWSEPDRMAYLIRADGELAGLALMRRLGATLEMAEFLILPKFRRAGIGTGAARRVFTMHPGPWRIRQTAENHRATQFWRRAIPAAFSEEVEAGGSVTQTFNG